MCDVCDDVGSGYFKNGYFDPKGVWGPCPACRTDPIDVLLEYCNVQRKVMTGKMPGYWHARLRELEKHMGRLFVLDARGYRRLEPAAK